jgi:hypothetical protein
MITVSDSVVQDGSAIAAAAGLEPLADAEPGILWHQIEVGV